MKFSLAATALCALSSASAAAVPVIDARAPPVTVVGTIDGSVQAVKNALPAYLSTIGMFFLNNSTKSHGNGIK